MTSYIPGTRGGSISPYSSGALGTGVSIPPYSSGSLLGSSSYSPGRSALDAGRLGGSTLSSSGHLPYESSALNLYGTSPTAPAYGTGIGTSYNIPTSNYGSSGNYGASSSVYGKSPYGSTTSPSKYIPGGSYGSTGYSSGYGSSGYSSSGSIGYSSSRRDYTTSGTSRWKLDKILADRHQVSVTVQYSSGSSVQAFFS